MVTNSINSSASAARWSNAFIPQASRSWEGKPTCVDKLDGNPNCCATAYEVEYVVDEAYEHGLEEHPGVKAIAGHPRPCVTSADLEILMDQLAPMSYQEPPRKHIPGTPEKLDLADPTGVGYVYDVKKFCIELVKSTISYSYGAQKSLPQKNLLGEHFDKVHNYCARGVERYFGLTNIIKNKLPIGKPSWWEVSP